MRTKLPWVMCGFLACLCLYFALRTRPERFRDRIVEIPKEVIKEVVKEVEVERIVEVPTEVIKEVQVTVEKERNFTEAELYELRAGRLFRDARKAESADHNLAHLKAFSPKVIIPERFQNLLNEEALKTKIELKLRLYGIKVDREYGDSLAFVLAGMVTGEKSVSYTASLSVHTLGYLFKFASPPHMQTAEVIIWMESTSAVTPTSGFQEQAERVADLMSDAFANKFLEHNPKVAANE